jgi:branched-chain amino acid transport system substrate-binding protein
LTFRTAFVNTPDKWVERLDQNGDYRTENETMRFGMAFGVAVSVIVVAHPTASAGAGDIVLGQTMPYSGPVSAVGTLGKAMQAYFEKVNADGGVNGRKITLLSRDDAYSPPKTVEQTRRLIEQDEVLAIVGTVGSATNASVQKYLNQKKVPQLFVASGADPNPKEFPWTMGWLPSYAREGAIYGKFILAQHPDARIAILFQQDDYGREFLKGFTEALGSKADAMIAGKLAYQTSDPTIESQVITLRNSGANIFFSISTHRFTSQAIRKARELNWNATIIIPSVSASIEAVLKPAGLNNSNGVISGLLQKDPADPAWADDPAMKDWRSWMDKYYPAGDKADRGNVAGYTVAQLVIEVLKNCGSEITRENIMKQAADLHNLQLPMVLPGITASTTSDDYQPFGKVQLHRFDGRSWLPIAPPAN